MFPIYYFFETHNTDFGYVVNILNVYVKKRCTERLSNLLKEAWPRTGRPRIEAQLDCLQVLVIDSIREGTKVKQVRYSLQTPNVRKC